MGLCDETLFPVVTALLALLVLVVGVVGASEHAFVQVVTESPRVIVAQLAFRRFEHGVVAAGEVALGPHRIFAPPAPTVQYWRRFSRFARSTSPAPAASPVFAALMPEA